MSHAVAPSALPLRRRRLFEGGFPYWHELVLVALLAALMIFAARAEPDFVKLDTQLSLSADLWERALLALPMTLIIITAGIDLSVGSTMALSAVAMGVSYRAGVPMPLAMMLVSL